MTQTSMTIDRVLELIETYGANVMAWPELEQDAAEAVISAHPDLFSEALNAARALDAALAFEAPINPDPELASRILADAPEEKKSPFSQLINWTFRQRVRWPAGAVLSSLAIGVVGGYAYASAVPGTVSVTGDEAYDSAFGYSQVADWLAVEESE